MILRTTPRRNRDGSEVAYYQLADNVWDAKRTVLEDQVDLVAALVP